jgi:HEAT repeat protein
VPDPKDLEHLSGLLNDEIQRFRAAWQNVELEARRELVRRLLELAEDDFAMDFSAIFRLATEDEDAFVRAIAITGLEEVDDPRLTRKFSHLLHHDPSSLVRTAAAQGLARFVLLGELQKINGSPFQTALTALIEAYHDTDEDVQVRRCAVEAMAYTGTRDVPEIIREAYEHSDEAMRISAVLAMGRSADARWADTVISELHNPTPEMRFEAIRACGELQLREATQDLIELTDDVNLGIKTMALWSLGQIGGRKARRTLERHADAENDVIQETAQAALNELEFLYGDLTTFFGAPEAFSGESDVVWDEPEQPEDR